MEIVVVQLIWVVMLENC